LKIDVRSRERWKLRISQPKDHRTFPVPCNVIDWDILQIIPTPPERGKTNSLNLELGESGFGLRQRALCFESFFDLLDSLS
jgi:hypothetical protein